jgi:hypothetical protein
MLDWVGLDIHLGPPVIVKFRDSQIEELQSAKRLKEALGGCPDDCLHAIILATGLPYLRMLFVVQLCRRN